MTPDLINARIAEYCGWTFCGNSEAYTEEERASALMCWVRPGNGQWQAEKIPNYYGDLNAMHEAEKSLSSNFQKFEDFLNMTPRKYYSYLLAGHWGYVPGGDLFDRFNASASVRAEKFLKTIGKWK